MLIRWIKSKIAKRIIKDGGYGTSIDDVWLIKREPMEETGKSVEAIRKEDGSYEYRVIED